MTNEAMLQLVNRGIETGDYTVLVQLKNELTENIRLEVLKKAGTKTKDIAIIKRIIKSETFNKKCKFAHKFTYENKEYFGFTEGHFVVACNSNMGIEELKEDYDKIKIADFINPSMFYDCVEFNVDMIDLKTFCKTHKRSDKKQTPYIIEYTEGKKIGLNAYYLLDTLEFNDTNIIHISGELKPVIVQNKDKDTLGMVLPIRM